MVTRVLFPHRLKQLAGSSTLIADKLRALGTMSLAEKRVALVFGLTAFGWIFQANINSWLGEKYLDNTIVAMVGGILMFVVPANIRQQEYPVRFGKHHPTSLGHPAAIWGRPVSGEGDGNYRVGTVGRRPYCKRFGSESMVVDTATNGFYALYDRDYEQCSLGV